MFTIDEQTKLRFYELSRLVADVDGTLSPEIIAAATDLDFEHGLFLHPSPLRTIALWSTDEVWMYRYLELNIFDGTVYKIGEPQTLAPVGHPLLAEQVARMLARAGRDLISSIADRIYRSARDSRRSVRCTPVGGGPHGVQRPRVAHSQRLPGRVVGSSTIAG